MMEIEAGPAMTGDGGPVIAGTFPLGIDVT
jgi:hypothetical protein